MYTFFNSQFFIALVTLIVGSFAIFLYLKQKEDYKRQAASLILQEIRYAEQLIRASNQGNLGYIYGLAAKLLPTNSWNDNIHLFLNDLEETEIDLISRFYSKTAYLDVLISKVSDFKNQPTSQQSQITITPPNPSQQILVLQDPMKNTLDMIKEVSDGIRSVYNTPTGEKLKSLSRRKFLFIF